MADLICSHWTTAGVLPAAGGISRWPIEARVRACAEAGYVGYGLQLNDYRSMKEAGLSDDDLKAIFRHYGMRHIEIEFLQNWFADGEAGKQSRRDELALYHMAETFDARVMVMTGELAPDITRSLDDLVDKFAAVSGRAAARGVTIGVEACAFSNIATPVEALQLIQTAGAKNAGVYLDVWHLYRRGFDYGRLGQIDPAMIAGVQINDASREVHGTVREDSSNNRLLPGEGSAGVADFLTALNGLGYAGPLAVEILSEAQRALAPDEAARLTNQAARAVVEAASGAAAASPFLAGKATP